jgi:FkbM family methyltransferase
LEIFVFGIYGRAKKDIQRSNTIIDIGANVGFFAIYCSTLNSDTEIHTFEPFPKNVEQMKENLLLNADHHVHVHPEAVSAQNGRVTLYFTLGDDSGCTLNESETKTQACLVNAVSINELFKVCDMQKCDLLKMDCEGSELSILQAASSEVLAKIRTIIMEYHNPADVNILTGILSRSGFKFELLPEIKTLYATRG